MTTLFKKLNKDIFEWKIEDVLDAESNTRINTWTSQVRWSSKDTLFNGEKECQD